MRVDGLAISASWMLGDVEMYSGMPPALRRSEAAVEKVAADRCHPVDLGGDHTVTWPDVTGVARGGDRWGRSASSTSTPTPTPVTSSSVR